MRLVDSSAWIEWLVDSPTGIELAPTIPTADQCVVPTIVQLEVAKWLTREVGEDKADSFIAFTRKCRVVDLDTATALRAAELCRIHRLATADAIVYATALIQAADVLTCDAHFEGLPGVVLVGKLVR